MSTKTQCDQCSKDLTLTERYMRVKSADPDDVLKTWDICFDCWERITDYMRKWKK